MILNWNGKEYLKGCLDSLHSTAYSPYRVIVVDNGSTDGSQQLVRDQYPRVELVENGRNLGFPAGNNVGIRYAVANHDPEYILLLNNDTRVIDPNWLTRLVETARSDVSIGIVGCLLLAPDGAPQRVGLQVVPGVYLPLLHRVMDKPGIGISLIRRSVIERVGLLDEGYYKILFEDVDYIERAVRAGFKVLVDRKSLILHYGSGTLRRRPSSEMIYVYKRNGTRFIRKYYGSRMLFFALVSYAGCLGAAMHPGGLGRFASFYQALRMTTKGIADGLVS